MLRRSVGRVRLFSDPKDCSLPSSSDHRDSPAKDTGVVCYVLLQRKRVDLMLNKIEIKILRRKTTSYPSEMETEILRGTMTGYLTHAFK